MDERNKAPRSGLLRRLTRLWRHLRSDERAARRLLPDAALQRLGQRIAASEAGHSGEIRVVVEAALPLSDLWRDAAPRDRALALFGELGVWDTEHNNGVLLFVLLAEHAIEIVADRGLAARVAQAEWAPLLQTMREAFRAGRFEDGLNAAIDALDQRLRLHFPLVEGRANPNELPDAPLRR